MVRPRDPLRVKWIARYCAKRGVVPATWWTCDLFAFKECLLLILTFFSISRPFEMSFTDKTENELWEIITTGLRWGDIKMEDTHREYIESYLHMVIRWYKNQMDRSTPKDIYMAPPTCGNSGCICYQLEYVAMFDIYKKRCKQYYIGLKSKISKMKKLTNTAKKMLDNLEVAPNKYIFVGKKGAIWGPQKINEIVKDVKKVLGLKEELSGYSTRLGAVSLCRKQEIDILKVIRYVVWSVNSLPHISTRYMKFTIDDLKILPFEMIHGKNVPGQKLVNRRFGHLKKATLWSKNVEQIIFG